MTSIENYERPAFRHMDYLKYGIYPAIIMEYLRVRINENIKLNRCSFGKKTWVCAPIVEICDYFPGLTYPVIRYAVCKLLDRGVLQEGNFNRTKYDRAKWYAFTDEKEYL